MANILGRTVNVGIGRESTRGTVVAAQYWENHAQVDIDDKAEAAPINGAFGQLEDANDVHVVRKWMEGSLTSHVKVQSFALWLYSLCGGYAVAAVGGESVVYDHTITVQQGNAHQSLTIATNDGIQDYRYANSVVTELELILEAGGFCDYKVGFRGRNGATATNTVSYSANDKRFIAKHATFKKATDTSGLAGASAANVHRLSLKVNQNVEDEWILGSITPNDFPNRQFSVEGELEMYFADEATWKTPFLAGTTNAMQITLTNSDVTIGNASNPTITIVLAKAMITDVKRDLGVDGIVRQTVSFKGLYSSGDTKMISFVVRNLIADYSA